MSIDMNSVNSAIAERTLRTSGLKEATSPQQTPTRPAVEGQAKNVDSIDKQRQLHEAIDRVNEMMQKNGRALNFSVDKVAQRTVITVKNSDSGEVVRQIPDEAFLRVAHTIEELKGLLYHATI